MPSEPNRIKVLLADDHSVMRDGLRLMLEGSGEFTVVGHARDGEEAVRAAVELSPDVVVMDVMMPNKDGVEACREIMEISPGTRVVMLTASTEEDAVIEAVAAGATGYLQKVSGMERLLATVRDVAAGELRVPADVTRRVFAGIRDAAKKGGGSGLSGLTQRELAIVTQFSRGMSYGEIAESRGIKPVTVRNAIYNIQGKLYAHSKQELVVWAVRNGLLDD